MKAGDAAKRPVRAVERSAESVWRRALDAVRRPRIRSLLLAQVIFALKGAVAAGLAYVLAHYMPGVLAEYTYYAPLGAVTVMSGTISSSLRTGLQTIVGVGLGVLVAFVVLWIDEPFVLTVPLAVGVGMLFSTWHKLGSGGMWVPVIAIFVLLSSGGDPAAYSLGYLAQLALGAAVGLAVQSLVFPPLYLADAGNKLIDLKHRTADALKATAAAVENDEPGDESWDRQRDALQQTAADAREVVRQADESRRGNPRALRHGQRDLAFDYERLRSLETTIKHVSDVINVLGARTPLAVAAGGVGDDVRRRFSEALRRVADVVRIDSTRDKEGLDEAIADSERALDELDDHLDVVAEGHLRHVQLASTAITNLRAVLETQRNHEEHDDQREHYGERGSDDGSSSDDTRDDAV